MMQSMRSGQKRAARAGWPHVSLVDADQTIRQLEHVVPQRDDNELRILGALLDVVRNDAHVLRRCSK